MESQSVTASSNLATRVTDNFVHNLMNPLDFEKVPESKSTLGVVHNWTDLFTSAQKRANASRPELIFQLGPKLD